MLPFLIPSENYGDLIFSRRKAVKNDRGRRRRLQQRANEAGAQLQAEATSTFFLVLYWYTTNGQSVWSRKAQSQLLFSDLLNNSGIVLVLIINSGSTAAARNTW
jgi:hypothetical protein